jgi:PAS domain S-box-containing protein
MVSGSDPLGIFQHKGVHMTLANPPSDADKVWEAFHSLIEKIEALPAPAKNSLTAQIQQMQMCLEDLTHRADNLQAIFQNAQIGIILTQLEDRVIVDANPAWQKIFGLDRQEFIGLPSFELGVIADQDRREEAYRLLREVGYLRNFELTYTSKADESFLVSINADVITIRGSQYILTTSENMTERRRIETALRHSEEKFAKAFRSSPLAMTIVRRADGQIIDANDYFLRMMGYCLEDVLGHTYLDLGILTSPETQAKAQEQWMKFGRVSNMEVSFPIKSGKMLTVISSIEMVEIAGESCLLSTVLDITEQRHLEAEQIHARAEMEVQKRLMEQREQERSMIARDIHDGPLQTLASTTFHLKLIKETFPDHALEVELNQMGLHIRKSVQELREIVNDLRPPALIHFGFSQALQIFTEDFRDQHPEIKIELDVAEDGKQMADTTRLAVFRVYQEGLNNIIKHAKATRANVVYRVQDKTFLLAIQDNGKGFDFQGDYALLTLGGHYGLAGMKERVEAVGGEFKVASAPGTGTTLTIRGRLS